MAAQGTRLSSFREARESLAETLEIDLTIKQIERVTERIGAAAAARRDVLVASWDALPLVQKQAAPAGVTAPDVAAVSTDGGRLQLTDREEGSGTHWREDKAAVLMAMTSPTHEEDPCPEIPAGFLDAAWAGQITREIGKCAAAEPRRNRVSEPSSEEPAPRMDEFRVASGLAEPSAEASPPTIPAEGPSPDAAAPRREPPKLVRKQVVATLENSRSFSPQVAAAAWALGFFGAKRKAYVGDGQNWVWTLFEDRFKPFGFVGVLDIIHALTYVYAAATAGRDAATGTMIYRRWIAWLWQGRVDRVIEELSARLLELGRPEEHDGETHPRQIVAKSLTYLINQQPRMNYPDYRRQGLPITSAYIESVVKQLNQRVKGSEKFWTTQGGEALLQLKAAQISNGPEWDTIWHARTTEATGQRPNRPAA